MAFRAVLPHRQLFPRHPSMKRTVDALTDGTFDLLILGGGITGAGVALDAALRGLRVALIDKSDFASGTSSVSSKLVHGGIRYLEYGQFPLVYEACTRPHVAVGQCPPVPPLVLSFPSTAGPRASLEMALGLTLYDLLAGAGNLHRGRRLHLGQVPARAVSPPCRRRGCTAAAAYSDVRWTMSASAWKWCGRPAREGAIMANYVEAVAFEQGSGVLSGVHAVDHLSGQGCCRHANPQRHGALGGRRLPPARRPTVPIYSPRRECTWSPPTVG